MMNVFEVLAFNALLNSYLIIYNNRNNLFDAKKKRSVSVTINM